MVKRKNTVRSKSTGKRKTPAERYVTEDGGYIDIISSGWEHRLYWYDPFTGEFGLGLGEEPRRKVRPKGKGNVEVWIAQEAARPYVDTTVHHARGTAFVFSSLRRAKEALAAVNKALHADAASVADITWPD